MRKNCFGIFVLHIFQLLIIRDVAGQASNIQGPEISSASVTQNKQGVKEVPPHAKAKYETATQSSSTTVEVGAVAEQQVPIPRRADITQNHPPYPFLQQTVIDVLPPHPLLSTQLGLTNQNLQMLPVGHPADPLQNLTPAQQELNQMDIQLLQQLENTPAQGHIKAQNFKPGQQQIGIDLQLLKHLGNPALQVTSTGPESNPVSLQEVNQIKLLTGIESKASQSNVKVPLMQGSTQTKPLTPSQRRVQQIDQQLIRQFEAGLNAPASEPLEAASHQPKVEHASMIQQPASLDLAQQLKLMNLQPTAAEPAHHKLMQVQVVQPQQLQLSGTQVISPQQIGQIDLQLLQQLGSMPQFKGQTPMIFHLSPQQHTFDPNNIVSQSVLAPAQPPPPEVQQPTKVNQVSHQENQQEPAVSDAKPQQINSEPVEGTQTPVETTTPVVSLASTNNNYPNNSHHQTSKPQSIYSGLQPAQGTNAGETNQQNIGEQQRVQKQQTVAQNENILPEKKAEQTISNGQESRTKAETQHHPFRNSQSAKKGKKSDARSITKQQAFIHGQQSKQNQQPSLHNQLLNAENQQTMIQTQEAFNQYQQPIQQQQQQMRQETINGNQQSVAQNQEPALETHQKIKKEQLIVQNTQPIEQNLQLRSNQQQSGGQSQIALIDIQQPMLQNQQGFESQQQFVENHQTLTRNQPPAIERQQQRVNKQQSVINKQQRPLLEEPFVQTEQVIQSQSPVKGQEAILQNQPLELQSQPQSDTYFGQMQQVSNTFGASQGQAGQSYPDYNQIPEQQITGNIIQQEQSNINFVPAQQNDLFTYQQQGTPQTYPQENKIFQQELQMQPHQLEQQQIQQQHIQQQQLQQQQQIQHQQMQQPQQQINQQQMPAQKNDVFAHQQQGTPQTYPQENKIIQQELQMQPHQLEQQQIQQQIQQQHIQQQQIQQQQIQQQQLQQQQQIQHQQMQQQQKQINQQQMQQQQYEQQIHQQMQQQQIKQQQIKQDIQQPLQEQKIQRTVQQQNHQSMQGQHVKLQKLQKQLQEVKQQFQQQNQQLQEQSKILAEQEKRQKLSLQKLQMRQKLMKEMKLKRQRDIQREQQLKQQKQQIQLSDSAAMHAGHSRSQTIQRINFLGQFPSRIPRMMRLLKPLNSQSSQSFNSRSTGRQVPGRRYQNRATNKLPSQSLTSMVSPRQYQQQNTLGFDNNNAVYRPNVKQRNTAFRLNNGQLSRNSQSFNNAFNRQFPVPNQFSNRQTTQFQNQQVFKQNNRISQNKISSGNQFSSSQAQKGQMKIVHNPMFNNQGGNQNFGNPSYSNVGQNNVFVSADVRNAQTSQSFRSRKSLPNQQRNIQSNNQAFVLNGHSQNMHSMNSNSQLSKPMNQNVQSRFGSGLNQGRNIQLSQQSRQNAQQLPRMAQLNKAQFDSTHQYIHNTQQSMDQLGNAPSLNNVQKQSVIAVQNKQKELNSQPQQPATHVQHQQQSQTAQQQQPAMNAHQQSHNVQQQQLSQNVQQQQQPQNVQQQQQSQNVQPQHPATIAQFVEQNIQPLYQDPFFGQQNVIYDPLVDSLALVDQQALMLGADPLNYMYPDALITDSLLADPLLLGFHPSDKKRNKTGAKKKSKIYPVTTPAPVFVNPFEHKVASWV